MRIIVALLVVTLTGTASAQEPAPKLTDIEKTVARGLDFLARDAWRDKHNCVSCHHAARIRERQNPDGGWSQAKDMPSDAWATGQALYALAHTAIKPGDPAIARAHAFLIKTQRDDGSWPMTSRPMKPGGEGSTSLIPITGAGSAWGVLGLVRSKAGT